MSEARITGIDDESGRSGDIIMKAPDGEKKYPERTREEINDLKAHWISDPCWDIDEAKGFEAHWEELKFFKMSMERRWKKKYHEKLLQKAAELGVPGNTQLAEKIISIEKDIHRIAQAKKGMNQY